MVGDPALEHEVEHGVGAGRDEHRQRPERQADAAAGKSIVAREARNMIIAMPIETMIVEQSIATPVQGSPAWRRMITGRKMNRTNSHKASVERSASDQRAWLFNDGMKCATPPGDRSAILPQDGQAVTHVQGAVARMVPA